MPINGEHQHPLEGSRLCQEDTGDYEHSKKSVSCEVAHITPLPLPWDPGNDKNLPGVVKTGPYCKVWQEDSQGRLQVQAAP